MRFPTWAIAVGVGVLPLGLSIATVPVLRADADVAQAAKTPQADAAANEAAIKHAKRTACLKEAKAKKLTGAERNSYVKDCVAAS